MKLGSRIWRTAALAGTIGATLFTFPSTGVASRAADDGCVVATAAKTSKCAKCAPTLKGSAFQDSNPRAGDVGTTAGQEAVLAAKLNRGCKLPKGSRMVLIRQEINSLGNPIGASVRLRCSGSSCRVPQTRTASGGYRYQIAIVGCKGAKRSKVVTVFWAPKPVVIQPQPLPSPSPTPVSARMMFKKVSYFRAPTDTACTAPLPGGTGSTSASYIDPNGSYNAGWEWTVPPEINRGAGVTLKVNVNATGLGGYSASISIRVPSEFGISPTGPDQIEARVPVGQTGSDHNDQSYTFSPNRNFVVGEKLTILIGTECAVFLYEYEGV